jgi:AAA15 family ATPase/GTPase
MRIREIYFHNVRAFRGAHRISFVDPLTDAVRPVTVIAGTNGTGKTTIYVLERLLDLSPGSLNKNHFPLDQYLSFYMYFCSTPPADMVNLIERIIKHAGQ